MPKSMEKATFSKTVVYVVHKPCLTPCGYNVMMVNQTTMFTLQALMLYSDLMDQIFF